jgi:hypothetical protein
MTGPQAAGLRRTCSIATAGAAVAAFGLLTGIPTAIATGLLVGCGGTFVLLISYLETLP